ncbi:MAG: hypothetical protein ACM3SR_10235 [Ignavibacteriales bacterium]
MKKLNFIAYLLLILLAFFVIRGAQGQNIQEIQPLPGHVEGPVIMNNGIVWPLENLDLYQNSTLDPSTLGKRIEQKSNVELNQPKENRSEVRGSTFRH